MATCAGMWRVNVVRKIVIATVLACTSCAVSHQPVHDTIVPGDYQLLVSCFVRKERALIVAASPLLLGGDLVVDVGTLTDPPEVDVSGRSEGGPLLWQFAFQPARDNQTLIRAQGYFWGLGDRQVSRALNACGINMDLKS